MEKIIILPEKAFFLNKLNLIFSQIKLRGFSQLWRQIKNIFKQFHISPFASIDRFDLVFISKNKANKTELHLKVRLTC